MATSTLNRQERKKRLETQEARRAGIIEPEKDEHGKEINPYIPDFIADAPWYLHTGRPGLDHQRREGKKMSGFSDWYARGKFKGPAATKYRKGACENCGAMTHKTLECVDRPRKKGAKWTNEDIQPDEVIVEVEHGFEAKRDRWNGYNPKSQKKNIAEFEKIEAERRLQKSQKQLDEFNTAPDSDQKRYPHTGSATAGETESLVDEANAAKEEATEAFAPAVDPKTKSTTRNLRNRSDTAKYLKDLDDDNYDPQTRSMRGGDVIPVDEMWETDDTPKVTEMFEQARRFAWEAASQGVDVHFHAAPSQTEVMYAKYKEESSRVRTQQQKKLIDQYGGAEYLKPKETALLGETMRYVEYNPDGSVVKGKEVIPSSKYKEDELLQNHKKVWGSFWRDGKWGYACCGSFTKNSYCTGKAPVFETPKELVPKRSEPKEPIEDSDSSSESKPKKRRKKKDKHRKGKKHKHKKRKRDKKKRSSSKKSEDPDVKKYDGVTTEQLEEYRRKRVKRSDPMRDFM
mmetsp:Transcript_2698/g.3032  ORF Transcript_2698/g.3032 Transcript_2698/m.3032 type:complete len:514 (-) Transcript_2698:27-1568(-)